METENIELYLNKVNRKFTEIENQLNGKISYPQLIILEKQFKEVISKKDITSRLMYGMGEEEFKKYSTLQSVKYAGLVTLFASSIIYSPLFALPAMMLAVKLMMENNELTKDSISRVTQKNIDYIKFLQERAEKIARKFLEKREELANSRRELLEKKGFDINDITTIANLSIILLQNEKKERMKFVTYPIAVQDEIIRLLQEALKTEEKDLDKLLDMLDNYDITKPKSMFKSLKRK